MSSSLFADPMPVTRLGRSRTLHLHRVLIEDGKVVVRTACGLDRDADRGFSEEFGVPTCEPCIEARQ